MNAALIFLAVLGIPALIALSAIWRGYVLSVMWGWFVVPTFGLRPLSVALAIGISLIVSMLTLNRTGKEVEKEMTAGESFATGLLLSTLVPAMVLLFGWITRQFV